MNREQDRPIYTLYDEFIKRFFIDKKDFFNNQNNDEILNMENVNRCLDIINNCPSRGKFSNNVIPKFREQNISSSVQRLLSHAIWLWSFSAEKTRETDLYFIENNRILDQGFGSAGPYHNHEFASVVFCLRLFKVMISEQMQRIINDTMLDDETRIVKVKEYIVNICLCCVYKNDIEKYRVQLKNYNSKLIDCYNELSNKQAEIFTQYTTVTISEILLYLSDPDHYERVVSRNQKVEIVRKYNQYLDSNKKWLLLDYKIYLIRKELEGKYGSDFDFYDENGNPIWRGDSTTSFQTEVLQNKIVLQQSKRFINSYSAMLIASKNIILHGAPATGKSYLAKKIAADIVSNGTFDDYSKLSDALKQQIKFVQFHPSYDYTDFVEGLRPKLKDGSIGFELQDGIFKKFISRAREDYEKSPKDAKNYVFIIDEINRGEISKIFGELFFAIDPGYRGKAGEISTQYANMHSEPNDKFYIPENVFIIGTMNDIDKSVDSFDFAMRRRFRFIHLKANECTDMLAVLDEETKKDALDRMIKLNDVIANTEGLNEDYQIGASYFLKLQDLKPDQLWLDYLQPLLQEYVRGLYDETSIMRRFAEAYGFTPPAQGDANDGAQN